MTTIIATKQSLFSDSQLNAGNYHLPVIKLFQHPMDGIFATAGDSRLTETFERAFLAGKVPDISDATESESFEAVLLDSTGLYYFDKFFARYKTVAEFVAIGSGALVAKSWLREGASPEEALEKVIAVDPDSGGNIQCLSLPKSKRK